MSRIASVFRRLQVDGRKALIPFVTAGDPTEELTLQLLHVLVRAGADIIELGVPFSDPMADGPTIQRASERALAQGVSLRRVLAMVARFRIDNDRTPIVLMGYANPIEAFGLSAFAAAAGKAGVDGVLVVDYPPEEAEDFAATLRRHVLDPIFLIAPTSSDDRIARLGALASGYIYYVSLKGVTGSMALDVTAVAKRLPAIRERTGVPVGVGFGIRDAAMAAAVAQVADAVVVGSRIIEEIEASPSDAVCERVNRLVSSFRRAMDAATLSSKGES